MTRTDPLPDTLDALEAVIRSRRGGDPGASYVARLFAQGRAKIAQKVGEEAVEAAIAAVQGDRAALKGEAADLLFHLLVLLVDSGLRLDDVRAELARREGLSGLAEKAARVEAAPPPAPAEPSIEPAPPPGPLPLSGREMSGEAPLRAVPPPEPGRPRPLPTVSEDY